MFRKPSNSPINKDHVGAGTILPTAQGKEYQIVAMGHCVALLDTKLHAILDYSIEVFDVNFLTKKEYDRLVSLDLLGDVPLTADADIFRKDELSPVSLENFGVGSLIVAGHDKYIVTSPKEKEISLLNAKTFQLVGRGPSIEVMDVNFLTKNEVRKLLNRSIPTHTFSDFGTFSVGFFRMI